MANISTNSPSFKMSCSPQGSLQIISKWQSYYIKRRFENAGFNDDRPHRYDIRINQEVVKSEM